MAQMSERKRFFTDDTQSGLYGGTGPANTARIEKTCAAGTVFVFFVVITAVRFFMLNTSEHPTGLDGYFYALQAKSFMLTGSLENPDTKIGYYLCGLCSLICGDAIIGCKLWAAVSNALLSVGIFVFVRMLFSRGNRQSGLYAAGAAMLLSAVSPAVTILCINYINNQTGVVFFFLYGASAVHVLRMSAAKNRASYASYAAHISLTFALCILCMMSHLVSACYALIFTGILMVKKLSFKLRPVVAVVAAAGFVCACAILFTQLARFKNVFALTPVLPLFSPFMIRSCGFALCFEISVYFAATWALSVVYVFRTKRFDCALLFTPVLFFPFWRLDVLDMGYRMLLNAVPAAIVFIAYMLNVMFMQPNARPGEKINAGEGRDKRGLPVVKPAYCVACAVLCALVFCTPRLYKKERDPPYGYYRRIIENIELDDDSLLIAHLGLNHVYTYYKNLRDSLNYIPDFYVPTEKLWRLAYGVHMISLEQNIHANGRDFAENVRRIDSHYVLIREDYWREYLANEEEEIAETYKNWFNPYTVRPAFIRKKAKSF